MILSNFSFDFDGPMALRIASNDRVFDLHNDYDFAAVKYDVLAHTITLTWVFYRVEYLSDHLRLNLAFKEVAYFEITRRDPEMPLNEDETLCSISYINPNDDICVFRCKACIDSARKCALIPPQSAH